VSLVLNFAPIEFDDREITVGRLPYGNDGAQVLEQLREEHNGTHVFRRDGAKRILAVSVVPDAHLIGKAETIRLKEHLGLSAALIRNAILNYLAGLGWPVSGYKPVKFNPPDDLLQASLPKGLTAPTWLAVRLLYELAIRPTSLFGQKPFVAAALDVRTTQFIERTAAELIEDGFPIKGCYVGNFGSNKDSRLAPRFEAIGCVAAIKGSKLLLADSRDGIESVASCEAWLERREFRKCLSHYFKGRTPTVVAALERQRTVISTGPTQLDHITRILASLASQPWEMVPGVPFTLGTFLDSTMPSFSPPESAPGPTYVFDDARSKTDTWHDRGLNTHGPYTTRTFKPSCPRICVVCQQVNEKQVKSFVQQIIDGLVLAPRNGKPTKNNFKKGFRQKYALDDVYFKVFTTEDKSVESYKKACRRAIVEGGKQKWDLALVQIEEAFRKLPTRDNPYFATKMGFYLHQIPVQGVRIETVRQRDTQLSSSLNNMCLAMYAKLDGIPWLLRSGSEAAHELVIGVGCADVGEGRFGGRKRQVGITTVFAADGNYYLYNASKAVAMAEYRETLLDCLREALSNVKEAINWQPKDHVRIIFHSTFKQFKRDEIESVKALLGDFCDCEVSYAFLRVMEHHPCILFDTNQPGQRDPTTGRCKGQYAPARGSYIEIGKREVLLSLTGPRDVKRPEHGMPRPILLSLHPDSTFTDMKYLTDQFFAFAGHSWRTFLPCSSPVTILYPNLIANGLGHLSKVESWNPDLMLGHIGRTPWFL